MSKESYFQFPLSLLSIRETPPDLCNRIICFGTIYAGSKQLASLDDDEMSERCKEFKLPETAIKDGNLAFRLGSKICGVPGGSSQWFQESHASTAKWEATNGNGTTVRIKSKLVREVRDGGRMSWRELRVLCAIYSSIGDKDYAIIIPQSMIMARHCGFASQAKFAQAMQCEPRPEHLTNKELRGTIEKLWQLKFFARVTPCRHGRKTYYSHRMDDDELRAKILNTRTYKAKFRAEQEAKNKALADQIQAATGRSKQEEKETKSPCDVLDVTLPPPKASKAKGSLEELKDYAEEIGLPASDGEYMFDHWTSNGWKNGSNTVKDWKAGMKKWKAQSWLPSQKPSQHGKPAVKIIKTLK